MKLVKKQKPSKYQFGFIQIDAETKLLIEKGFARLKSIKDWESFKNMPEDLVVRPALFQAFSQVSEHVVCHVVDNVLKAIREGKELEFREVGSKDVWVIDGNDSVEGFTAVEAVAKYIWLARHHPANDVISMMRGLADQLEEIEGLK